MAKKRSRPVAKKFKPIIPPMESHIPDPDKAVAYKRNAGVSLDEQARQKVEAAVPEQARVPWYKWDGTLDGAR